MRVFALFMKMPATMASYPAYISPLLLLLVVSVAAFTSEPRASNDQSLGSHTEQLLQMSSQRPERQQQQELNEMDEYGLSTKQQQQQQQQQQQEQPQQEQLGVNGINQQGTSSQKNQHQQLQHETERHQQNLNQINQQGSSSHKLQQQNEQLQQKPSTSIKTKRDKKEKVKSKTDVHDFLYGSGGFAKVFQLERKKPSPGKNKKASKLTPKTRKSSTKPGKRMGMPKSGKGTPKRGSSVNEAFYDTSDSRTSSSDIAWKGAGDSSKKDLSTKQNRHGLMKGHRQISNELQPIFGKNHRQDQQRQGSEHMTPEQLVRTYLGNEEYAKLLQLDGGDLTTEGSNRNVGEVSVKDVNANGRGLEDYKNHRDDYYDDNGDNKGDDGRENGGWGKSADTSPNNNSFETLLGKHFGNYDKNPPASSGHKAEYDNNGGDYDYYYYDESNNDGHDDDDDDDDDDHDGVDGDVSTTSYISFLDLGNPVQTLECPTSCVCEETVVDCSGQNFSSVPKGIGPMTTILDLSMNNIEKLPEDCFAHLPHLEQLSIVSNNLTRLPKKLFKYNTLLRQLNLQGNKFEKVPPRAFQNLQYLLELHLDSNKIKSVPINAFKGLFRLQTLRLDANHLDHIPTEAMWKLTGLQALSFAKNEIKTVPALAFRNNTRLIHILLANNLIEEIEDNAFLGLSRLKYLQLERNMIRDMPTSFSHLTSLEELNLERNRLSHLPDRSFQFMGKLTMLGLKNNPIRSIGDKVFAHLPSLTELVLSEVHDLVRFPDLTGTTRLRKLQLDRANIKSLPKDLCRNLPNITSFDVHSNKIGTIPNMSLCVQLSNLNMANNELTSLDGHLFKGLSNLLDLTLSNNFIHSIPANAFIGLSTLEYLNLAENQISTIHPDAFVPLKALNDLNLGENHIGHLPTAGLAKLQKLKVFNNKELREFPPKEAFPHINHFVLSYAYHCCDFIHSRPEKPTGPDFVENLTLLHPDSRVSDVLKNLHANFSKEQLKLYENMTIDKNHDVIMSILNEGNEFTFSSDENNLPYYQDGYQYDMLPFLSDNGSDYIVDGPYGDGMLYDHEVLLPKASISCRPKPGPFMPCDDLFGWWALRCGVWIVFLLALLGNFVVFFVSVTSRSKMDVPRFLICNLALADFIMGIYLGMLAIVDASTLGQFKKYAIQWQMSPGCLVAGFLGVFSSELSVFTLTVITLERFYAITHAMQLNKRLSLKHSSVIMLCGWIFCFGIAVMPLFGISDYRQFAVCLPFEIEDIFSKSYVCFIMTFNGIAFFIILSCYLIMYISIRDSQAWNSNETRVAKRMALLVFTDFMCWAPIAFLSLAAAFGKHLIHLNEAKVLTIFILPLNSCANPFLYAFFTKQFKKDCVLFCRRLEDSSIARHFSQVSQRHVSVSWKCQRRQSGLNSLMGDGKSQNSQNNSHASNSYGLVNNYNSEVSSGTNKDANVKDTWVKDVKASVRAPPKTTCSLGVAGSSYCGRYLSGGGCSKDDYKYSLCPDKDVGDDIDVGFAEGNRKMYLAAPNFSSRSTRMAVAEGGVRRMGDAQVTLHEEPYTQNPKPKQNINRSSHAGRCNHAECSKHPMNQQRPPSLAPNIPKLSLGDEYGIISDEESSVWKKMSAETDDITLTSSKTLPTLPFTPSKIGSVDGYYSVERPKHSPQKEMSEKQNKESLTYIPIENKRKNKKVNIQQHQHHLTQANHHHNPSSSSKHNKRRKHIHCCSVISSPIDHNNYEFISPEQNQNNRKNHGKDNAETVTGKNQQTIPEIQYVLTMPEDSEFRNKMDVVEDQELSHVLKCFSSNSDNGGVRKSLQEKRNNDIIADDQNRDLFDNNKGIVDDVSALALQNNVLNSTSLDKNRTRTALSESNSYRQNISPNSNTKHRKHKSDITASTKHKSAKTHKAKQPPHDHNSADAPLLTREFLHHHRTVDKSVHLRYFQQSIEGHNFLCKSNSLVELTQPQLEDTRTGKFLSSKNTLTSTKRGSLSSSPSNQDAYYAMLNEENEDNLVDTYHHLKHHQTQQINNPHHNHHTQQPQQQQLQCNGSCNGNSRNGTTNRHNNHNHHNPYCNSYRQSSGGEVSDEVLACSRCDSLEMENYSGEQTSESIEEDFYHNSNATSDLVEDFNFRKVSSSDRKRAKREEIGGILADSDTTDEFDGKNDSLSSTRHSAGKESGFHSQI